MTPVLVLTRDPVADRIGSVVVAAVTRTRRLLVSELDLAPNDDGVPTDGVINFDNIHTIPSTSFRRHVTTLTPPAWPRRAESCKRRRAASRDSSPVVQHRNDRAHDGPHCRRSPMPKTVGDTHALSSVVSGVSVGRVAVSWGRPERRFGVLMRYSADWSGPHCQAHPVAGVASNRGPRWARCRTAFYAS